MKGLNVVFTSLLAATVFSVSANATPINPSIDMTVKGSSYVVGASDTLADIRDAYDAGSDLNCNDVSLSNVGLVSGKINCGARGSNIVTSISFDFTGAAADWSFRLGSDWGRGGAFIVDNQLEGIYSDDYWWGRNWNSGDVIYTPEVSLESGFHSIEFIGFEGCCEGGNSLQYSYEGSNWQTVSLANLSQIAEVPEPSSLALFGLGALIAFRQRARKK